MDNVLVLNTKLAKEQLENCPQEVKDYVMFLEASCERWSELYKNK
jgi:hypothetical protein